MNETAREIASNERKLLKHPFRGECCWRVEGNVNHLSGEQLYGTDAVCFDSRDLPRLSADRLLLTTF